MKKSTFIFILALSFTLAVCAQGTGGKEEGMNNKETKIKITAGNRTLTAIFYDNPTARAIIAKLPLTIPLSDLYAREMCYHFPEALPTDNVRTTGYEVGEIIYWPPRHSFVIMYAQNGERFSMQKIGRVDSGVEIFKQTGDVTVILEALK
jgi:hypothetical protein